MNTTCRDYNKREKSEVQLNSKLNKISVGIMAWTNLFFV
jgi:hypothetical protein